MYLAGRGIAARRVSPAPEGAPAFPAERGAILFDASSAGSVPAVWEAARATGVVVLALERAQRPLEDVFLEAIAQANTPANAVSGSSRGDDDAAA